MLEEAFEAFDIDNSGELDVSETRDLLHVLYYDQLGPATFAQVSRVCRARDPYTACALCMWLTLPLCERERG